MTGQQRGFSGGRPCAGHPGHREDSDLPLGWLTGSGSCATCLCKRPVCTALSLCWLLCRGSRCFATTSRDRTWGVHSGPRERHRADAPSHERVHPLARFFSVNACSLLKWLVSCWRRTTGRVGVRSFLGNQQGWPALLRPGACRDTVRCGQAVTPEARTRRGWAEGQGSDPTASMRTGQGHLAPCAAWLPAGHVTAGHYHPRCHVGVAECTARRSSRILSS